MSSSSRSSVVRASNAWYPACRSDQLRPNGVLATRFWGRPMVLFRTENGSVSALDDRCPHRNVPLSKGQVVKNELQCAYHGWRFNGRGECTAIPGLSNENPNAERDTEPTNTRSRRTHAYPTQESQGFVWVWPHLDLAPDQPPFVFPEFGPAYTTLDIDVEADASLQQTIENALDVPHTAFLHRGLFRSGSQRTIHVRIVSAKDRVEAFYDDEPAPDGLLGKILAPSGGVVEHCDRFILPCIQQVEYRIGADAHVLVTGVCQPLEDRKTRMYVRIFYRTRLPDRWLGAALKPLGLRIFGQDAEILKAQRETIEAFGGERFSSTELDVLGGRILRLLRALESNALDELEVEGPRTLTMVV